MSDYLEDKYKPEAICPRCGAWNWKPIMYHMQKKIDTDGQDRYSIVSKTEYTCKSCGCRWSESWDRTSKVSLDALMLYKEEN